MSIMISWGCAHLGALARASHWGSAHLIMFSLYSSLTINLLACQHDSMTYMHRLTLCAAATASSEAACFVEKQAAGL